jgi:hypothetical protein
MAKLPPQPLGVPPGSSYFNDWYEKLRTFVEQITTSVAWSIITGTPTTLAGYGITNGQTVLTNSAGLAAALSDETGTGLSVFNNTPTLITPNIGVASGTSINLTGGITTAGAPGITVVITTAKLTGGGVDGSMTFTNGILTAQVAAT